MELKERWYGNKERWILSKGKQRVYRQRLKPDDDDDCIGLAAKKMGK